MQDLMIPTNGIHLHAQVYEKNGPALLFLHFGNSQLSVWNLVVPFFRERYHVVTLDLRGHGRSDKPADGYDYPTMAADVAGLMDALGIAQAHLVGSSLGSDVGAFVAAQYPERVLSLALEGLVQNSFGPYGSYEVPDEQVEAFKADLRAKRAARAPVVGDSPADVLAIVLERWGRPGATGPFAEALAGNIGLLEDGRYGLLCPDRVTLAYLEYCWETRFDQVFERVTCPVLFLPDESYAEERAQQSVAWFRSKLAQSYLTLIPDTQHAAVILDQPQAFARAVLDFHTGIGARAAT